MRQAPGGDVNGGWPFTVAQALKGFQSSEDWKQRMPRRIAKLGEINENHEPNE
jgi:hypothetical protein